jgi:hypothetical protein
MPTDSSGTSSSIAVRWNFSFPVNAADRPELPMIATVLPVRQRFYTRLISIIWLRGQFRPHHVRQPPVKAELG